MLATKGYKNNVWVNILSVNADESLLSSLLPLLLLPLINLLRPFMQISRKCGMSEYLARMVLTPGTF